MRGDERAADIAPGGQTQRHDEQDKGGRGRQDEGEDLRVTEGRGLVVPPVRREPDDPGAVDRTDAAQHIGGEDERQAGAPDRALVREGLGQDGGQPDEDRAEGEDGEAVDDRPERRGAHRDEGQGGQRTQDQQGGQGEQGRSDERRLTTHPGGEQELQTAGLLLPSCPTDGQGDGQQRHGEGDDETQLVDQHAAEGVDAGDVPVEHPQSWGGQ